MPAGQSPELGFANLVINLLSASVAWIIVGSAATRDQSIENVAIRADAKGLVDYFFAVSTTFVTLTILLLQTGIAYVREAPWPKEKIRFLFLLLLGLWLYLFVLLGAARVPFKPYLPTTEGLPLPGDISLPPPDSFFTWVRGITVVVGLYLGGRYAPMRVHLLTDAFTIAPLVVLPFIFLRDLRGTAVFMTPVLAGLFLLAIALFTSYDHGVWKRIGFKWHLLLEGVASVLLLLSPWLFGFLENQPFRVWALPIMSGIVLLVMALITKVEP